MMLTSDEPELYTYIVCMYNDRLKVSRVLLLWNFKSLDSGIPALFIAPTRTGHREISFCQVEARHLHTFGWIYRVIATSNLYVPQVDTVNPVAWYFSFY